MGSAFEQIIAVLNTDTGNLAYNLVLSFSLAGALFFAIAAAQRDNTPAARRTIFGLSLLLVFRLALFVASGLVWQGFLDGVFWLPLLDRAATLLSLIVIVWLWAFPEPSPSGDAATLLLSLLVLTGVVLGGVWWSDQGILHGFNHSTPDVVAQITALVILGLGMIVLLTRRPEGWVLGLVMELLLLLGHSIYLIAPADQNDYPAVVRLFQMAAYPFLLLLAQRLPQPDQAEDALISDIGHDQGESLPISSENVHPAGQVLGALEKLTADRDPTKACQLACASVVELMDDDICLLIDPPDDDGRMLMRCAYDRSQGNYLEGGYLLTNNAPVLTSALKLGRSRRLVAGSEVLDFKALGQLLNRSSTGDVLYVPVLSAAGSPLLMICLLSPLKKRNWSREEQALLRVYGRFLVYFLQQNQDMAQGITDLELASQARRVAQDQAQSTLELNQKLRDQLVVLQEDIEQKSGRVAAMAARVAAGVAAQESLSKIQDEKDQLKEELEELSLAASQGQIAQQKMEELRKENEALQVDLKRLSEDATQKNKDTEGELRLALEEILLLQKTLHESENKIHLLKSSLSEAPASSQQIASVIAIAQDLRQPLSSIVGYTDFLMSEVIGILGDKQRKYLERVRLSTDRMRRLVDELLQTVSPESNLARLDIEEIDLGAVLQRAIVQSGEHYDDRQVNLHIDIPDSGLRINADQSALQRVFRCLLDNAGLTTPEGGEVSLLARLENMDGTQDYVLVQVVDSGGGIAAQDLPNVFSFRPSGTAIPGLGVNGTDWSEIKSLVEVHGGRIWVDSQEGHGATFSVLLPVAGSDDLLSREAK